MEISFHCRWYLSSTDTFSLFMFRYRRRLYSRVLLRIWIAVNTYSHSFLILQLQSMSSFHPETILNKSESDQTPQAFLMIFFFRIQLKNRLSYKVNSFVNRPTDSVAEGAKSKNSASGPLRHFIFSSPKQNIISNTYLPSFDSFFYP